MKGFAFGIVGANSWGVATSVVYGTRFSTDGGMKRSPQFIEDRSFGEEWLGPAEAGDLNPCDLTLTGQARYEDHNGRLRALAMGSPAAVTISTSATGQTTSWLHVVDLAPSIDGRAITLAFDRKLFVEECATAKVYGFSERPGDGGVIEESFRILGVAPTHTSTINTNSVVYSASYPALNGRVLRQQGVFRINAQSGGALGGSDTISVLGTIEFSFERPQDRSYVYGSADIMEPADNEFPLPSIRLIFNRANTLTVNSFRSALQSGTAYKADITYSGAFINSTDRYSRKYEFPYVEIQDHAPPTSGAQQVKPNVMFMLKKPSAAPTGMSGVTQPFRLREIKTNSLIAF